jgi:2'-5' RNA ligase
MARLFVAIRLSPRLKQRIQKIQPPRTAGITPVAAGNLHLTLQFIGKAPVESMLKVLSGISVASFQLEFSQASKFKKGLIWLGVKDSPELKNLQLDIVRSLVKVGLTLEPKRFMPHITLGRYKRHVSAEMIELLLKEKSGAVPAETVIAFGLYASTTVDDIVTYTCIRAFALEDSLGSE